MVIQELDFFVTSAFANGLYDSCKNVLFPSTNEPAIQLLCGPYGVANCSAYNFLSYMGSADNGMSPVQINYFFQDSPIEQDGHTLYPLNVTMTPCNEAVKSVVCYIFLVMSDVKFNGRSFNIFICLFCNFQAL